MAANVRYSAAPKLPWYLPSFVFARLSGRRRDRRPRDGAFNFFCFFFVALIRSQHPEPVGRSRVRVAARLRRVPDDEKPEQPGAVVGHQRGPRRSDGRPLPQLRKNHAGRHTGCVKVTNRQLHYFNLKER